MSCIGSAAVVAERRDRGDLRVVLCSECKSLLVCSECKLVLGAGHRVRWLWEGWLWEGWL